MRLPSGGCNYTNLGAGGNAPVCGCRRFWDKALIGPRDASTASSGFCMCEHHACFHDDVPRQSQAGGVAAGAMADMMPKALNHGGGLSLTCGSAVAPHLPHVIRQQHHEPGQEVRRDAMPDAPQCGRHFGSLNSLPAIPSQCLLPSDSGSVTSGSVGASIRPSGLGRTFNPTPTTTSGRATGRQPQTARRMQVYEDANGNVCMQSLTEVATPSARASQDPVTAVDLGHNLAGVKDALEKYSQSNAQVCATPLVEKDKQSQLDNKQSEEPLPRSIVLAPYEEDPEVKLLQRLQHLVQNLAEYPMKISNHDQRLDLLENSTFHDPDVGDLQDADDRLDNRVCEIEERLREIERVQAALNDASSVSSKQIGSFDSRVSVGSSAMTASAMDRLETARLQALEAQIHDLQAAALPSPSRPWEIEVVFLPFGSNLKGIWSSQQNMSQRSRMNSLATDDWTQTQNNSMAAAQACLTAQEQASAWEYSATDLGDQESTWLMARACASRSRVDERLRSRGLVRSIRVLGPDARDVQVAIMNAFGELPHVLAEDPYSPHDDENADSVPRSLRNYLGLSAPWVPLRKIHKDSCLRYLNPSEMVTPALWTVPFLSASVAMRHSGVRRLYVTQKDSYIQQLGKQNVDWTWQKLRRLPRVYSDTSASLDYTPEHDAEEPCWEFDERLDPPHESVHSTFTSLSIRSPPSQSDRFDLASRSDHFSSAAVSPDASITPTSVAPAQHALPLSPLKERNPFRPMPVRTTSMPTTIPIKSLQSQHGNSKRCIASSDCETQPSSLRAPSTSAGVNATLAKRRRISRSRSPSRPRDTPKYSTGPSSPYAPFDDGKYEQEKEEGMTPFAYATPFSNAPYIPRRGSTGISIYEDGSEDELVSHDAGDGDGTENDHENENGASSVDGDVYADDMEYEANALSDCGQHADVDDNRLGEQEWEGMQDDGDGDVGPSLECSKSGGGFTRTRGEDEASEVSSVPSEYPSRQPGFQIHIDDELAAC